MTSEAVSSADVSARDSAIARQWPAPLTAQELDERFPGILDGVAFLSGAANIIMQLGRPAVGYGVAESRVHSGNVFKNPVKRARTTFTYLAVAMLGTTEEKLAYRAAVNRSHAQVHSTAKSPVKYNAFDPGLQLWVAACLFWGLRDSIERFRGPLGDDEVAELLELAKPLATTLQVRPESWPRTRKEFETYFETELQKVTIDPTIRGYLNKLVEVDLGNEPIRLLVGPPLRFLTLGFLPQHFREQMRYDWTEQDQKLFERVIGAASLVNRGLPRVVRQAPSLVMMWDFRRRLAKGLPLV